MDSINSLSKSIATLDAPEGYSNEPMGSQQIETTTEECSLAVDLRQKLQRALEEVDALASYAQKKKQIVVGLNKFRRSFESELQYVKKNSAPGREQYLRTSNTVSIVNVWAATKRCTGLVALRRKYHSIPGSTNFQSQERRDLPGRKHETIDIVAEGGLEWVKVCLKNERRIIFDLAKAGFGADDSDRDHDQQHQQHNDLKGDDTLLECAEFLFRMSQQERVRYKHPTVRIMLPSIRNGGAAEVEKMLREISAMGITVQTAEDIPEETPLSADILTKMVPDPTFTFTDTINVDVNAMLTFVSDFSHIKIQHDDSYIEHITDYINMESKSPIMPKLFWPACGGRKMVCTCVAANKFFELVNIIGTDQERARASLLLRNPDDKNTAEMTREERIKTFQTLSIYDVPPEWNLPIEIDDMDMAVIKNKLPAIHEEVCKAVPGELQQSVFLYGWVNGLTTITSNQAAAKSIERAIEENRILDEDVGPDIWTAGSCRPLLGRSIEKRKKRN